MGGGIVLGDPMGHEAVQGMADGVEVATGGPRMALAALKRGQEGVICESRLEADDAALLKAMGLCTNASVKIVRTGEPCVVAVGGVGEGASCTCGGMCRIGLARGLAERIFVTVMA